MYYNIKTVITISILYVKYKYMYQHLCIYISIGWMATTDSYITYKYISIPTINEVTQSQIKFYKLINISSPLSSPVFNYTRLVLFSYRMHSNKTNIFWWILAIFAFSNWSWFKQFFGWILGYWFPPFKTG